MILIVLALVSTPILVHRLGPAAYGVLILALTLGGLLAVLDFGLTPALINSLSHALEHEDREVAGRVLGTALTLFLALGTVAGATLALLSPFVVTSVMHVPSALQHAAVQTLRLGALGLALNMWLAVFNAVPYALERYELVGLRQVAVQLVVTAAVIAYALVGGTVVGFMVINVVGTAAGLMLFYFVARRLLPGVSYMPGFDPPTARRLGRFSAYKLLGTLGGFFTFRFDQIAIAALLGVVPAALYAIPANALARLQGVIVDMAAPLFPRVSRLRSDIPTVARMLLTSTRVLALAALTVLVPLFVLSDIVLREWIGGREGVMLASAATGVLRLLAVALTIQAIAAAPFTLCEAVGRPEIPNGFSVLSAVIHVPLVLILVPRFGIAGAALTLFINSVTQTALFILYSATRVFRLRISEFLLGSIARPLLAGLATGALGWLVRPLVHGRWGLLGALGGLAIINLAIAVAIGGLTRSDVRQVWNEGARLARRRPLQPVAMDDSTGEL